MSFSGYTLDLGALLDLGSIRLGASAKNFGVENWADYKPYFYPEDGDYSKTLRWKFVDELMNKSSNDPN